MGFTNFYQKFIGNYSNIARPIIDLTKKNEPWNWSEDCQRAFTQIKEIFMKEPVLQLPDLTNPFAIVTDASKYVSGGVLLQKDSNGEWHLCSYLSQSFAPTEQNYDIYDRELLAIIWALKTWRHYLQGSETKVLVFTDHKNLRYFKEARKLNRRQARWMLDLADNDLKFVHVPRKQLSAPDTLSRRPDLIPEKDTDNEGVTLLPQTFFV